MRPLPRNAITRRRFVQGIAAAGLSPAAPRPAFAIGPQAVLSGTEFRLETAPLAVNITGQTRTATAINGQIPGPILRWREGDTVTLAINNRLAEPTSIHWHSIRVPSPMDGVPGLSFRGIAPGETFVYRFPVRQSGTAWYHSHSGRQEQTGLYGPLVIEPRGGYAHPFDRDYVVMLSDWSDESPETIVSNLKFQSDYYNFRQRTLGTFIGDVNRQGLAATVSDRLMWGEMRMSPTDILDVSGATYTYLVNGQPPAANWTALFRPGERVRLRFINGSAMSIFDVRIPDLPMTVIQADGNDVEPVTVDEFRISVAETYDVIVEPTEARAYTIFAQAEDRTGYASGTLAPRADMSAPIPPMDPRPLRTMTDMGMGGMDHGAMEGMSRGQASMPEMNHGGMAATQGEMQATSHSGMHMNKRPMPGMSHGAMPGMAPSGTASGLEGQVGVDNVAMMPTERLDQPGDGFPPGRRVLRYTDLHATRPGIDPRPPGREIVLHLTGNMERFMWGVDGKKYSEAGPIIIRRGERVRFTLINDTMMEHPMHLHGLWSELENGHGEYRPYKHTINVKPGEKLSFLVNADEPGRWAFHCHLLYHMESGMFREVRVL
ncbi:MAG: copper resistance system multicopper oxidase [Thiohalocapsa sp.]